MIALLFGWIHQIAEFHERVRDRERRKYDAHDVKDLRERELDEIPVVVNEIPENGDREEENAHAYRKDVYERTQYVEGLQYAVEHNESAERDGEQHERIDGNHAVGEFHAQRAQLSGDRGDRFSRNGVESRGSSGQEVYSAVNGKHAQDQGERPRNTSRKHVRGKFPFYAVGVRL